jgi:integrase
MPICAELHEELARWKYAYGVAVQEIPHLDWHVIPPFRAPGFKRGADGLLHLATRAELIPTRRLTIPHYPIQLALGDMGYATLDEGGHTLRRSGGYALYQRLSHLGHDRAGRIVQSMYGHKSFQTTEKYLRLSLERKARDDILRGQRMFDEAEGKVIHLGEDRAGDIRLRQV